MSQQIINLGSGPDTQTGDTISVAFTKVNNNFTELYSVFDGNGITTINANVIFANNIVTSTNVRTGNLFAYGNIESIGYVITAGAFYPNGIPIGSLEVINSNLIPEFSNVYTLGSVTQQFSQAYIGSNLTLAGANLTVIDGNLYINNNLASGNYGNSNVAAFLPVYSGNLGGTITTANQPNITTVGILTALGVRGNLVVGGNLRVEGNVTYFNVENLTTEDPIINLNTGANGAPLSFNNGYDSGVKTNYYNSGSRSAFFGRINSSGFFEYYSNVTAEVGNIVSGTYGTIKSANLILIDSANIAGNVTGNYFLGNGRFLSGIDATSIQNGNSNVKVYANGNVSVTTAGTNTWDFDTTGNLVFPGGSKIWPSGSNIDLVAAPGGWAELQSFNANSYVWVDDNGSYIGTNWTGASKQWTFGSDGNLSLPGNVLSGNSVIKFVPASSGDGYGSSTIELIPETGVTVGPDQFIVIDPTSPNHIHIRAGGIQDNSSASLFLGGENSHVQIAAGLNPPVYITSNNQSWTFGTDGNLIAPGNIAAAGNINAPYFNGNFSGNFSGTVANTQVLFSDNNLINGTGGFTFDKATNLVTIGGTVSSLAVNVAGYNVIDSNGNVVTARLENSGVTAGTYGNASAVPVITVDNKGRVTVLTTTAVAGVDNVTYDSITSNLTVFTSAGTNYSVDIGVGTADSPIFSGLSVSGNTTVSALTVNNNATINGTLSVASGIQNTPIGNAIPSTAIFTSESVSGNSIVNALTVNNSATVGSTLGVTRSAIIYGGIQNTIIGNVTPSSATFTSISVSGNITANALTVNNSTTIGSTLGVTGNIVGANIKVVNGVFNTVESATIGNTGTNYTGSTYTATGTFNGPHNGTLGSAGGNTAIVSTLSATGAATVNSLQVNNGTTIGSTLTVGGLSTLNSFYANTSSTVAGNLTVVGNLVVSGNVIASGSNNTYFTDSIIELHTLPNLANLTFNDGKDIGIRFHYYKTQNDNAFLGWQNETGYLEWIGSGATEDANANIITGNYGTIKSGELILANSTPSTGLATGALQVNGGASFSGNIYANGIAYFGNATAIALTNPLLVATTTANTYAQIQIQNQSTGGAASSDFIATADDGTDTTKYIDMGINGSGWNQSTWTVSGPRDGYLYTSGVNLTIGTDTVGKTLKIHTGGLLAACVVATFNDAGTVSSSSSTGALVLTGGLGVSGAINGGSTLGLVGNATVAGLAVNNTATIGGTLGVTGNVNGSGLTLSGSMISIGPAQHIGGLQATPIGNAAASTGQFTTVSATGNITGAALSSNSSITAITSLSALGGIQNTPIGNVTPSTAIFTSESVSGNSTVNALTVNNSATIGTTLGVTGNINGNGITLTGSLVARGSGDFDGGLQSTPIGNATASTGQFTTVSATGNITGAALTSNGSATIGTSLSVASNITVGTGSGGNITGANIISANSFVATVSFNGPLNGVLGSAGGNTAIVSTLSATGNAAVSALTVNASATIGTTLGVTGNATVGNILASGFYFANGTPLTTSAGGTNGQLQFNSNSSFAGATYLTYQSGNGRIIANSGITSTSNVSGAIVVSGGVGVTGNVYVSQRVGFVAANSVSAVYQIYNAATNSLDTIFG